MLKRMSGMRARIAPRTALGMVAVVLAASLGAAFSGAVLYAYYSFQLQKTNDHVNTLINTYQKEFQSAQGDLANETAQDKAIINNALGPLKSAAVSGNTLKNLDDKLAPSLFFVSTTDENAQPSVGTAFAIASDASETLLLTSYNTIKAATVKPGPPVMLRQGSGPAMTVTVYNFDPTSDLALILLNRGGVATIPVAPATPGPQIGDSVFEVAGIGALGAQAAQGTVVDVSSSGIEHTAPVGPQYQGAPMVNADGQVVAVASRAYAPLNFGSDSVWFAPPIRAACTRVLTCQNGTLGAPGAKS